MGGRRQTESNGERLKPVFQMGGWFILVIGAIAFPPLWIVVIALLIKRVADADRSRDSKAARSR